MDQAGINVLVTAQATYRNGEQRVASKGTTDVTHKVLLGISVWEELSAWDRRQCRPCMSSAVLLDNVPFLLK